MSILRILSYLPFVFPVMLSAQDGKNVVYIKENVKNLPYVFTVYGAQQNLPQSQVASMMKDDESGKIILSTAYGLSSFDGNTLSEFRTHPYYGRMIFSRMMQSNRLHDALGFGSHNQLVVLSKNPKIIGRFADVDISKENWSTIDFNGVIQWHESGDYKTKKKFDSGLKDAVMLKRLDRIHFLVSGPSGVILINTVTENIKRLTKDVFKTSVFSPAHNAHILLSNNAMYSLDADFNFKLLYTCQQECQFNSIDVVLGKIIITSLTGLFILDGRDLKHYTQSDNFPTDELISVFYDSTQECLFLGSGNKGLLKLQPKRFSSIYGRGTGVTGSSGPMCPGTSGSFWFTNRTSVYLMEEASPKEVFDSKKVITSLLYMNDTIFSSMWGGGVMYKSLTTNEKGILENTNLSNILTLFKDASGNVWAGSKHGVYKGSGIFDLKPYLPQILSNSVTKIYEAKNGMMFLGGHDGLYLLDKDYQFMASYGKESGFTKNGIRSYFEDEEGKVWIGTYGNGLFCFTNGNMISLNEMPNCMIGNDVFSLARDRNGYLLITSNSGMRMVHETSLSDYLDGRIDGLIPFLFGENDGILNPEFNGGFQYNFATTDSVIFYFPSVQGLVAYHSQPMSDASYHLSLKEIKGDNQSLKKGEIIARNTNFLTFVFEDVDFHSFENVHYQYRIIRNDVSQDWSSIRKSTDVTIDYPEPGRYRIDFRRMDARNMITPLQISHSFYISPNFYETGWFLFLALMGLVLLIALSLWTYMERKQRLLQQEVDVKNTITELQLSSIQSQMNPHFMFNAMNVLIHMINLAPKRKAEEFAVSFASLMRKVLDQSRKSFISIEDEISTLQDYLFIQKQRLGPNFEYEIHCPVYIYKIQIPTMIIQPFVENAIIHGVSQVDWPGRISIIFSGNATNWQVEITDNGKGINNKNFKIKNVAKKSFGISLVQKKLELIKNRYDISIDMVISEKDPDEGLGTRVTLQRLPQ